MEFKRPEGSNYPCVYEKFKLTLKDSNQEEEFAIQDLTEEFYNDAVDILAINHEHGAVFHMAAGTLTTDEGRAYVKEKLLNTFKEKTSLICVNTRTREIVGLNCLYARTSEELEMEPQITDNENYRRFKAACNYMNGKSNIMTRYGVDRVLFAAGLCVVDRFRGNGFARRILAARAPLLKALGLTVTSAIFSTVMAQKAAKNAGYETLCEIPYEDLAAVFPEMNFPLGNSAKFGRVQALKI